LFKLDDAAPKCLVLAGIRCAGDGEVFGGELRYGGIYDMVAAIEEQDTPESSRPVGPPPSKSVGASALNGGELHALTAAGVIDAITKTGLPAPNPLDTTAQDCPRIGCTQSIVTDTVTVKSFETTGQAARFAVPRGLFQVATVVVFVRARTHGG
jgi:hypothetical protein